MESLPKAEHRSSLIGLRSRRQRSAGSVDTAQPRASVCSTAGVRRSSIHQVQGHPLPQAVRSARLTGRLGVPFKLSLREPTGEDISAHSENAADCAFGPALPVGLKNALLLFFGIFVRIRIKHEVDSAAFAMVLLRSASAVTVFDDLGASAFAAGVGRLNHGLIGPINSTKSERPYPTTSITTG